MKTYHKIPGSDRAPIGEQCFSFYKYDGSNFRVEWSPKRGFHKFGSRTQLIGKSDPMLGPGIEVFYETCADELWSRLREFKTDKATVFLELYGASSFAGTHINTEPKELKLFDVHINRKGIIGPAEFLNHFGDLDFAAELLFSGELTKEYIESVRVDKTLNEGVVLKGGSGHDLWMSKIKTDHYREKLKSVFQEKWELGWE